MEDAYIVNLYWSRNEDAIPKTAEKYGPFCYTIAKNILTFHEDAEECVNDTYLQAWNAMPPHSPGCLRTFLGKLTRNISFNRYKHNTAAKRGGGQIDLVLEELAGCVSGSDDVQSQLERKACIEAINAFLKALPPQQRSIFLSRYWYTDSVADIARRFQMTTGAVAMTLSRLRKKLRRHLEQEGILL